MANFGSSKLESTSLQGDRARKIVILPNIRNLVLVVGGVSCNIEPIVIKLLIIPQLEFNTIIGQTCHIAKWISAGSYIRRYFNLEQHSGRLFVVLIEGDQ